MERVRLVRFSTTKQALLYGMHQARDSMLLRNNSAGVSAHVAKTRDLREITGTGRERLEPFTLQFEPIDHGPGRGGFSLGMKLGHLHQLDGSLHCCTL